MTAQNTKDGQHRPSKQSFILYLNPSHPAYVIMEEHSRAEYSYPCPQISLLLIPPNDD